MREFEVSLTTLSAYLLCGGQSRRFGRDKARAEVDGGTLLQRGVSQLQRLGLRVWLVADRADKYQDLGLTALPDTFPGCGPLAGLHTACQHHQATHAAEHGWLLLTSCDQTELHAEWLQTLCAAVDSARCAAVTFAETSPDGKLRRHPFPGLFHRRLQSRLLSCLEQQQFAVQPFLEQLHTSGELLTLACPADWPLIPQVNTPEDWQAWQPQASEGRQSPGRTESTS